MQTDNNYDELPEAPTRGQQIKRWIGIASLLLLTAFVALTLYAIWTTWKLWTNSSVAEPIPIAENATPATSSFWNPQRGAESGAGGQEVRGSLINQPEPQAQPAPQASGQLAVDSAGAPRPAETPGTESGTVRTDASESPQTVVASASPGSVQTDPAGAPRPAATPGTESGAVQQAQQPQTQPAPAQAIEEKRQRAVEAAPPLAKRDAKPQTAARQNSEAKQPSVRSAETQAPAGAKQYAGAKVADTAQKTTTSSSAGIATRLDVDADSVIFIISGPPPLKGQSSKFGNRVILDVQGAWRITPAQPGSTAFLKKIRTAVQPSGTTRFVFDLAKEPSSWRLIQSNPGTLEVKIFK